MEFQHKWNQREELTGIGLNPRLLPYPVLLTVVNDPREDPGRNPGTALAG